ncbi:MAG: hypothetical protein IPL78_33425 [Chloroflexi bacterium]|nr:hypothetical protein [Chloroflexota bacterium]
MFAGYVYDAGRILADKRWLGTTLGFAFLLIALPNAAKSPVYTVSRDISAGFMG